LKEGDYARRMNYARWIIHKFESEEDFPLKIVVGDETGFALNGYVHTHNVAHYASKGQPPDFKYAIPNYLKFSQNVANGYLLIVKKFRNDSFIFHGVIKRKFGRGQK